MNHPVPDISAAGAIRAAQEFYNMRLDVVTRQRDALLAALEAIMVDDCLTTGTSAKARAAIALAKEGK